MARSSPVHHTYHCGAVSSHRRTLAAAGHIEAWAHDGFNADYLLELSSTGTVGTLLLTRQNLYEVKRAIAVAEALFERMDDRSSCAWLRPPERLVF